MHMQSILLCQEVIASYHQHFISHVLLKCVRDRAVYLTRNLSHTKIRSLHSSVDESRRDELLYVLPTT